MPVSPSPSSPTVPSSSCTTTSSSPISCSVASSTLLFGLILLGGQHSPSTFSQGLSYNPALATKARWASSSTESTTSLSFHQDDPIWSQTMRKRRTSRIPSSTTSTSLLGTTSTTFQEQSHRIHKEGVSSSATNKNKNTPVAFLQKLRERQRSLRFTPRVSHRDDLEQQKNEGNSYYRYSDSNQHPLRRRIGLFRRPFFSKWKPSAQVLPLPPLRGGGATQYQDASNSILFHEEEDIDTTVPTRASMFPLWRQCIAECFGVFLIVWIGTGTIFSSMFTPGGIQGMFPCAVVSAMAVVLAICSTAAVSGAELNPAISLAMIVFRSPPVDEAVLKRRLKKKKAPPRLGRGLTRQWGKFWAFVASQTVGAALGSVANLVLYGGHMRIYETAKEIVRHSPSLLATTAPESAFQTARCFGCYYHDPISTAAAFGAEVLGTAIIAGVSFALTHPNNPNTNQLPPPAIAALIGGLVTSLICIIGPISAAGFNPARDFGPRLVAFFMGGFSAKVAFHQAWLYIVAPLVGALIGGSFVDHVLYPRPPPTTTSPVPPVPPKSVSAVVNNKNYYDNEISAAKSATTSSTVRTPNDSSFEVPITPTTTTTASTMNVRSNQPIQITTESVERALESSLFQPSSPTSSTASSSSSSDTPDENASSGLPEPPQEPVFKKNGHFIPDRKEDMLSTM